MPLNILDGCDDLPNHCDRKLVGNLDDIAAQFGTAFLTGHKQSGVRRNGVAVLFPRFDATSVTAQAMAAGSRTQTSQAKSARDLPPRLAIGRAVDYRQP